MAVLDPGQVEPARAERLEQIWAARPGVLGWLTTTDHKRIGLLYFWTTLVLFGIGGAEALMMRTQLARANDHVVSANTYDELFTLHGITMVFFFIIPMTTGAFGNYLVPLMLGARDMAFPRLNALSYWIFLASGLFLYGGVALGAAPDAGWFNYVPLADSPYSTGHGIDVYCLGLLFNSIATTLTAAQFIVTIFRHRAPGMSFNRMPLFLFAQLAAAFGLIFALPPLSADVILLWLDRNVGTKFFDVAHGGSALLWQDLFWIFGHPEVYILIVPAFGIATTIIPTFSRRRMAAFPLVAIAELLVVLIGFGVWAHHMFATGLPTVTLVFFAAATGLVVIPSTIQISAWCMSLALGVTRFTTPLLFITGFIFMFVMGGVTGIMFLAIPFDQQVTDTYFVVAHFHYIIFGAAVFPIFGGIYFWFPKVTGRLYLERPGQISFWILFAGTNLLFFPMYIVGMLGMPRRVYTYPNGLGWTAYNLAETVGGFVTLAGILLLLGNLVVSWRRNIPAGNDPWHAPTLEWTTSSPPPSYNFAEIPRVRSPYPNWDEPQPAADPPIVLDRGHEQIASSPVDATFEGVVEMPHDSPWPILLAGALALVFAMVTINRYYEAAAAGVLVLLVLLGWHSGEPAAVSPEAGGRSAGWWGMLIVIASEGTLLLSFAGTYFFLRFESPGWPPAGIPRPALAGPVVSALVLVLASVPVALAVAAVRGGRLAAARSWLVGSLVLQCAYLAWQLHDLADQLDRVHWTHDAYTSITDTLLAADHVHVAVGIVLSVWLLLRLSRGVTPYRVRAAQAIGWYWHFVAAATVIITAVVLSGRW